MIEALCFVCKTYDWGTEDDRPNPLCVKCQSPRVIVDGGRIVSGDLRQSGGRRGKDTKIQEAYRRDAA